MRARVWMRGVGRNQDLVFFNSRLFSLDESPRALQKKGQRDFEAFSLTNSSFRIGPHFLLAPPRLLESPVTEERLSPRPVHRAQLLSSFSWLFRVCAKTKLGRFLLSPRIRTEGGATCSPFCTTCRFSLLTRKTNFSAVARVTEPRERCWPKHEPRSIQSKHAEQSSLKGTFATSVILLLAQSD